MAERTIIEVNRKSHETRELVSVPLSSLGILERRELQEWILKSPALLGKDIKVLDYEFDQFSSRRDRVDILALDTDGRVVVVELKREEHGNHADLQALRYAAKLRGVSFSDLVKIHRNALTRDAKPAAEIEGAERVLLDLLDEADSSQVQLAQNPRIILAGPGFSKDLTTTVVYLRDHKIDIRCVEIDAYQIGEDRVVLVPDVVLPLHDIDEYVAKVEVRDANYAEESESEPRRPNVVPYLVKHELLKHGDPVVLKHNLPTGLVFSSANPDFHATIIAPADRTPKLQWRVDGQLYSASKLASDVFKKYLPSGRFNAVPGPWHWGTESQPLSTIAFDHMDRPSEPRTNGVSSQ